MSNLTPAGSGGSTSTVVVQGASNPAVTNVAVAASGTEYSVALPSNCKRYLVKLRESLPVGYLQLAFVMGDTGVTYVTIPHGSCYAEDQLAVTGITLYFESTVAGQVVELLTWT